MSDLAGLSARRARHGALLLAAVGAEAVWISLVTVALARTPADGILPWWLLWLVGLLLVLWNRLVFGQVATDRGIGWRRWVASAVGGLVALSILMSLAAPERTGLWAGPVDLLDGLFNLDKLLGGPRPLSVITVGGLLLWYRTLRLVQQPATLLTVKGRFQLLLLIMLYLLPQQGRLPQSAAITMALLFFAFSILTLALSRAVEISRMPGSGEGIRLSRRWLMLLLGSALLFVGSSLFVVPLSRFVGRLLVGVLRPPVAWLLGLAAYVLALFEPLIEALLATGQGEAIRTWMENTPAPGTPGAGEPGAASDVLTGPTVAGIVLTLIAMTVVLWLMWRATAFVRRSIEEGAIEGYGAGGRDSRGSLAAWWRRLQPGGRRVRGPRDLEAVNTVRDLYRRLLLFGESHGLPRPRDETPYEYLAPLDDAYPARRDDFHRLTEAYVRVRYGEIAFEREELSELRAAVARIEALAPPLEVSHDG